VGSGSAEPTRGASFLVLLAFLLAFVLVRTNTRIIRSGRISRWPGNLETEGGLHIHHLVWGIALLLLCGFLTFATDLRTPWWQLTAVGFGVGAGLTLDEFALWLRLQDVYWSDRGRSSIDAVVIAALFAGLVVVAAQPFGLDEPASVLGTMAVVGVNLTLASLAFLKGRSCWACLPCSSRSSASCARCGSPNPTPRGRGGSTGAAAARVSSGPGGASAPTAVRPCSGGGSRT
jgi:hypothetical protein